MDELLNQPEINRKSIYEWKQRNSVLFEEVFPPNTLEDWEGEGDDNVLEGEDYEKPNQENLDAAKEQENSNDVEGETSVSKEVGDDISNEKQAIPRDDVKGNEGLDSVRNEQGSSENGESADKNKNSIVNEEEIPQDKTMKLLEAETVEMFPENEKNTAADSSGGKESECEETTDTRF